MCRRKNNSRADIGEANSGSAPADRDSVQHRAAVHGNRATRFALIIVVCIYVVTAARLNFRMCERFGMAFDMAIYNQAVWLISRGHPAFVTVRGMHLMADHFTPILYFIAPVYRVWSSPNLLLGLQCLAIGLCAVPIYHIALHYTTSSYVALGAAVAFLLNPATQFITLDEFHPETLSAPLLLCAFFYLHTRRVTPMLVALGCTCLAKETLSPTTIFFGLYALTLDRRAGLSAVALGLAGLVIALATMRAFNHGQPSGYTALYARYGDTPGAIARYLVWLRWE